MQKKRIVVYYVFVYYKPKNSNKKDKLEGKIVQLNVKHIKNEN